MPDPRPFPAATPHGELREILPDFFFVTGSVKMIGLWFSRNMTVIREDGRLVLVNTVRLDDAGLAALDKLGVVTDVIRLAGNHGMDDPFYQDRYKAKVSCLKGQRYMAGDTPYFTADVELDADSPLPIKGAKLHVINSKPPEGMLVLPHHGGVVVSGDCLQNWRAYDEYFSFFAKPIMKVMGFMKPHNIGPAWMKKTKPPKEDLRAIVDLPFVNVFPAHGEAVVGDAVALYRPVIERVTAAS
jgi:hypothetical protein